MAAVEVIRIQQPPPMPDLFRAARLDRGRNGDASLRVVGWAVGETARPVAVEITHRNRILAVAPVNVVRKDLAAKHPIAREVACGFNWPLDVRELTGEFELHLMAVVEDGSRVEFGSIFARHGQAASTEDEHGETGPETESPARRLTQEVADLIKVAEVGVAQSPRDERFIELLALDGKKVLVLAAGLGRLARAARASGADIVDAIEEDESIVKLARLITANQGVPRVFFYRRDLSDPRSFEDSYDLAIARSLAGMGEPALRRLAESTKVLIAEIPAPENGSTAAPESLGRVFPVQRLLQESEEMRIVAFASDEAELRRLADR